MLKSTKKFRPLVIAISSMSLFGAVQAQASIISVQWNQPVVFNTSIVQGSEFKYSATNNQLIDRYIDNYLTNTKLSQVIITQPTTLLPGLAYDYSKTTTSYDMHTVSGKQDLEQDTVFLNNDAISGGKYIVMSGNITATENTSYNFSQFAAGRFVRESTPFGLSAPTFSSFYFGSSLQDLKPSFFGSTYTDTSHYHQNYTNDVSDFIHAGETKSFVSVVYAASGVSLSEAYLRFTSGTYAILSQTDHIGPLVSNELVGATVLPAVPEPEEWALMSVGLGLIGFKLRKSIGEESQDEAMLAFAC